MLKLTGNVHVASDPEQLFADLGDALLSCAQRAVHERGVFHMALSGGGTPEPFYERLVTDAAFRLFPWAKTHVWIVDERCVPEDHEKSNIKMIREAMLDHVPIPPECVHPMPVMDDEAPSVYEAELSKAFDGLELPGVPQIDFILLGMGGDAHTASLFPQSPAQAVSDRWIAGNDGERVVPPARLTMTYPLINAGREVVVLLTGKGKYETLKRIESQLEASGPDIGELPITGIDPASHGGGTLTWYLDQAAAQGAD